MPFGGKLACMKPVILMALTILLLTSACVRPASTAEPFKGAKNPFTPEAAQPCAAADLETSSSAHADAGLVTLGMTLINRSQHTCTLQSPPQPGLSDAGQTLDVQLIQLKADAPTLSISTGESLILIVEWRNYCGEALKDNPEIHLSLTGGESLTIQTSLTAFPRCENKTAPSTLTINPYSYPP